MMDPVTAFYSWFFALDPFGKFTVMFCILGLAMIAWTYNLFETITIQKDRPLKGQNLFYIRQKGSYRNKIAIDAVEKIVVDYLQGELKMTKEFVGVYFMYDDTQKVKTDQLRSCAGICFPEGKVTPEIRKALTETYKMQVRELPECQVDCYDMFSFNRWSLLLNRSRALNARQRMLMRDGKEVHRYPLLEMYVKDRVLFAWPTAYNEDPAKDSKDIFVHPDDLKKNE